MLEILQLIGIKPNQHLEICPWVHLWSRRYRGTTLAEAISEECSLIHQPFGIPGVSSVGSTSVIVTCSSPFLLTTEHDTMTCHSESTAHSNDLNIFILWNYIVPQNILMQCALSTVSELHVLYGEFGTLSMHCSQVGGCFSWVLYWAGSSWWSSVCMERSSQGKVVVNTRHHCDQSMP